MRHFQTPKLRIGQNYATINMNEMQKYQRRKDSKTIKQHCWIYAV